MDTKTARQEALYILSVIERGSGDAEFMGDARRKFYELMKAQGCERRDYLTSIDACLTLPKPPGYFWELVSPMEGDANDTAGANLIDHVDIEQEWQHYAKTLPIAMLKAFWAIQPD